MVDGIAHERTQDALRAAHLYYMQDLTMEAIARELGTSRSSVSRLLAFARESGLVDIQIRSPLDLATVLGEQLHDRYGVVAHVVPVPDQTSDVDRVDRVALSAARMLTQYVDSNMVVGVAWGSTVSAVSRYLVPKPTHNTLVVQLNGAGNVRTTGIMYASEILRRFGKAYGATVQQFPVPAFFDDPATKLALWRERSTKRVLELQERMDMVLFGVGSPVALVPSHVYSGGYLERSDQRALDADGVVGDVSTVFFREDGSSADIAINARASGPDLATIRKAPRRVCVVAGSSKARSVRGALAAGLVTDIVLDEGTARALLQ
ncbi:Deoxyribonucleoside regulator [Clavibacter michiganensis]|uniref:Deoxyribonucleoside regulator n=1 Tax=Clavibacter michiganensis TaxID=28447 RepID=A0A251Y5G0_9MICO|nr:sugar-binding transcriptional regulator [Clavibacter michiganensis]OUE19532.1 Deoxyribonucleoside regulator [Clavibacter michiganensis]